MLLGLLSFSWTHPRFAVAPVVLAGVLLVWYFEAVRHSEPPVSRRQKVALVFSLVALVIANSWPVADLARTTSLLALVFQRELLVLAVAPLFLYAIPVRVGVVLTRPAPIDWLAIRLSQPGPAIAVTTLLFGVTALPFAVSAGRSNSWLRALMELAILASGLVLWNPVIRRVPGVRELTPLGMAGYLVVQSFAPTYLSFAWILAPHPLYSALHGQRAALGLSPLLDQQLSGYLAKLVTFGVLWPVAYVLFSRNLDRDPVEATTLQWTDVERHLERANRRQRKQPQSELSPPLDRQS